MTAIDNNLPRVAGYTEATWQVMNKDEKADAIAVADKLTSGTGIDDYEEAPDTVDSRLFESVKGTKADSFSKVYDRDYVYGGDDYIFTADDRPPGMGVTDKMWDSWDNIERGMVLQLKNDRIEREKGVYDASPATTDERMKNAQYLIDNTHNKIYPNSGGNGTNNAGDAGGDTFDNATTGGNNGTSNNNSTPVTNDASIGIEEEQQTVTDTVDPKTPSSGSESETTGGASDTANSEAEPGAQDSDQSQVNEYSDGGLFVGDMVDRGTAQELSKLSMHEQNWENLKKETKNYSDKLDKNQPQKSDFPPPTPRHGSYNSSAYNAAMEKWTADSKNTKSMFDFMDKVETPPSLGELKSLDDKLNTELDSHQDKKPQKSDYPAPTPRYGDYDSSAYNAAMETWTAENDAWVEDLRIIGILLSAIPAQ